MKREATAQHQATQFLVLRQLAELLGQRVDHGRAEHVQQARVGDWSERPWSAWDRKPGNTWHGCVTFHIFRKRCRLTRRARALLERSTVCLNCCGVW